MSKIHPNLFENHGPPRLCQKASPNGYTGGTISFPVGNYDNGVEMEFTWNSSEGSWRVSFPDIVSDEDLIQVLEELYNALPAAFNDEAYIEYRNIWTDVGVEFETADGAHWIVTNLRMIASSLDGTLCEMMPDELVYVYE